MSEIVVKIICFILLTFLYTYMIKKMLNSDIKICNKKNLLILGGLILISEITHTAEYMIEAVIIRFISYIIVFKIIFDESIYKSTFLFTLVMILNSLGDILSASILMNIYSLEEIRNEPNIMILSNVLSIISTYIIFNIKYINNKLKLILNNHNDNNIISLIIICVSIFLLMSCILYNIGDIFEFNMSYFINVMIIITFMIILIIFFIDNNKYQELQKENDSLFKYIQTFEDSIDKINLNNHEFKNEIIVLRSYIKENKKNKALNIIDDIILEYKKNDSHIINSLKNIPKGGIKGLLYYKFIVATNNRLKVTIDISKSIKGKLKSLDIEDIKLICNLIGIYLDNAIEASSKSKNKLLGIEMYSIDNKIEFVFSNTFAEEKIDIDKLSKNGYTTKGKNHGRGLYLAKKLVEKTEWINAETKIINKMYVQKIIISNKKMEIKKG